MNLRRFLTTKSSLLFDHSLKKRQRDWSISLSNSSDYEYLRSFAASKLIERLDDINRDFEYALDFGCHKGHLLKEILKQNELSTGRGIGGIQKLLLTDISTAVESDLLSISSSSSFSTSPSSTSSSPSLSPSSIPLVTSSFVPLSCSEGDYQDILKPNTFNLIMSSLWLHWINDLPTILRNIQQSLQPDGVFLGCMLGGSTLEEFRHAFYLAETERKGGVSPHMSPLVRPSDAAALLQAAGFALPTIDIDTVTIRYPNAITLLEHLRGMGEGQATINRSLSGGKETFLAMAAAYQHIFGAEDGSVEASFQIISMIGWRPHDSQPKPLRRGSAEKSMTEISRHKAGGSSQNNRTE